MIRLASLTSAGSITRSGIRHIKNRIILPFGVRSFSSDEKPKGIPYSKLTVGVPKERFPLEKRVAATPEVSYCDQQTNCDQRQKQ
jgi:hypothetical protein